MKKTPPKTRRPKSASSAPRFRAKTAAAPPKRDREEAKGLLLQASLEQAAQRYVLRLYVTGTTPASVRAIERVRRLCDEHLLGRYELEVIDLYQMPALAKDHQIIATPTLIKELPAPLRRFIGDLSTVERTPTRRGV